MNSFCGVLAIVGESNAGKSQLLNAFLQAPLAVVHHKRNLTRERMRAVITQGQRQLVIEDTAGLSELSKLSGLSGFSRLSRFATPAASAGLAPQKKPSGNAMFSSRRVVGRDYWTRRMREEALSAARSAELILWVIDATRGERALRAAISLAQQAGNDYGMQGDRQEGKQEGKQEDKQEGRQAKLRGSVESSEGLRERSFFALNKIDLLRDKRLLLPLAAQLEEAKCCREVFMLSAKKGDGIERARDGLLQALPPAPLLYEKDGDTRKREDIACEITRGILYDRLHEELPYDAQVKHELSQRDEDGSLRFAQRLHLRKESQRRILLTQEGRLLQLLERLAEQALQKHFSCAVQLNLHLPRARDW